MIQDNKSFYHDLVEGAKEVAEKIKQEGLEQQWREEAAEYTLSKFPHDNQVDERLAAIDAYLVGRKASAFDKKEVAGKAINWFKQTLIDYSVCAQEEFESAEQEINNELETYLKTI